jgi:hypothetical protein
MDNANKGNTSQKIFISVSTVLLVALIFFVSYYFMSGNTNSKYIDRLYEEKLNIDKANKAVSDSVKDMDKLDVTDTAQLNKIISVISQAEKSLGDSFVSLNKFAPPAKYKTQYQTFVQGVSSNKKIYSQANLILKNTKSKELEKAIEALDGYIGDTTTSYENAKLGKAYIKLPSDILTLWDKVSNYALASYSNYETQSRLLEQYTAYFNSMDVLIEEYANVKTDLNTYVEALNNNQLTIGEVYVEVEKKLGELNRIKGIYTGMAVPPKTLNQHKIFNSLINNYTSYCEEFKAALTELEEAGDNPEALGEAGLTFEGLYVRYVDLNRSYTDYKKIYDQDKGKYSSI